MTLNNDRRAFPRHEVRKDGRLLFVDQPCFVECTIRDISEDGALLSMFVSVPLPTLVLLWEQQTGAIHECEVRWRKGRTVGVHFTDVYGRSTRRAIPREGLRTPEASRGCSLAALTACADNLNRKRLQLRPGALGPVLHAGGHVFDMTPG